MATIKKKEIGKKEYYYLEHSFRKGKSVRKKELYLGGKIPKDIDEIKKIFVSKIYRDKWYKSLEKIEKNFKREFSKVPRSIKEKELESFMIRFTYDTQRIEGSKLTLKETANLLERGITPKESPIRDVKEAEAHKNIFYNMLNYKANLSLNIILYWHKNLLKDTKQDISGKIRSYGVSIAGSKFVPPSPVELNPLLEELFHWYNQNKRKIRAVELAALMHLKFVTIHPFGDGNGRISRLIMNFILKNGNCPLLDIRYENRNSYYNALERSQIKNDENIFVQWLIKKYIKENKRYLK